MAKVEIKCKDGNEDFELKVDRKKIVGLTHVSFNIGVNEIPAFDLSLVGSLIGSVEGEVRYNVSHPESGKTKQVKKIIFMDGTEWEDEKR